MSKSRWDDTAVEMEAIFHAAEAVRLSIASSPDQVRAAKNVQRPISAYFRERSEVKADLVRKRYAALAETLSSASGKTAATVNTLSRSVSDV